MHCYDDIFKQEFIWEVVYSVTTESEIIRLIEDKKLESTPGMRKPFKSYLYNVFEQKEIYEEFSKINTNNLHEIDDFINNRGFLGLYLEEKGITNEERYLQIKDIAEHALSTQDWEKLSIGLTTSNAIENIEKIFFRENLKDFTREVELMRAILILNSFENIKVSEEEYVKSVIKEIEDLTNTDFEMKFPEKILQATPSFILLNHKVKALISGVIALKMKNVKPKLSLTIDKEEGYKYINTWKPKSLIGCMYTMLYEDLSQGYRTAKCEVCRYPLVIRDNRDKRYHTSCRGSNNTANTRNNQTKQAKEYIVNKYYGNTSISTNEILVMEKPYIDSNIGKSAQFNAKKVNEWLDRKIVKER